MTIEAGPKPISTLGRKFVKFIQWFFSLPINAGEWFLPAFLAMCKRFGIDPDSEKSEKVLEEIRDHHPDLIEK
mgnify:CR=1 FL=1